MLQFVQQCAQHENLVLQVPFCAMYINKLQPMSFNSLTMINAALNVLAQFFEALHGDAALWNFRLAITYPEGW